MESHKKPLWQDILSYTRSKNKIAVALIIIGVLGLALPVLPGVLLIVIGLLILKPEWADKLKQKLRNNKDFNQTSHR